MSENIFAPFMREALALAENGRWSACPNPTVGAVLVRDGQVVARGWHHAAGQPHAEVECLRDAQRQGIDPAQCTLVVTLEPCNHYGKTPPCSEAVLAAGIKRVVIGLYDPTPKAAGGAERLRAAGVEVIGPVCERECRDQVADFLAWQQGRPYVILKMAATMDGRIATRTGHSRWVSSEGSRALVHRLRAGIGRAGGAVLVGGGTFRADNPCLTARIPGETVEQQTVELITKMVIQTLNRVEEKKNGFQVPVGVSARHIHLTKEHVEALFGEGYQLPEKPALSYELTGETARGDLQDFEGLDDSYNRVEYRVNGAWEAEKVYTLADEATGEEIYAGYRSLDSRALPKKLYFCGDSYRWYIQYILNGQFAESWFVQRYQFSAADAITRKPDVFIYELPERFLPQLGSLIS